MADTVDVVIARTLRIQTVVFRQSAATLYRLTTSLSRAVELARAADVVSSASLHIGDASGVPVLNPVQVEQLRSAPSAASFAELHYRSLSGDLGRAGAHNALAEGSTEDLVVVIDPTATADPRLVIELVAPLAHPEVAIVEARQLPFEDSKTWDTRTGETPWASFTCALVRSSVLRKVGPFDPLFRWDCDDVDFSWRTRMAGYRVVHRPSARVFLDRRLAADGAVMVDSQEKQSAALGQLLLAQKYGGADVVESLIERLSATVDEDRATVAEFSDRFARSGTADPLDPEGKIARFVDGDFAMRRF